MKNDVAKIERFLFYFLCGAAFFLPLTKAIANIFIGLALATFFARVFYKRDDFAKTFREYRNIFAVILILLGAVLISALLSDAVFGGVEKFLERYIFHIAIILPVVFVLRDSEKILRLAEFLLAGTVTSILILVGRALPHLAEPVWRFGGVLSPMIAGSLLAMTLPIFILLALHLKKLQLKIFFAALFLLGIFALLLTGTRGAWLAAIINVPLVILIHSAKKLKNLGAILISVAVVGAIFFFTPALNQRAATITDLKMQSNSERLLLWQSALAMFKDNPFFGVGYGSFTDAYHEKYISPLAKERNLGHAHNNFFQMLAECGIVGEGAFILLWIYLSYFCLTGWVREKNIAYLMFFSVLWGMFLHGLTEFNFETAMTSKFFWLSLGICLAQCRKERI